MFQNCVALTKVSTLPATELAEYCYANMFYNCSALVNGPTILPATTLVNDCYNGMFMNCTSLTIAPELPAAKTVHSCYRSMFEGCSNLIQIKVGFTEWLASEEIVNGITDIVAHTVNWVNGVNSAGTFICSDTLTTKYGKDYIPSLFSVKSGALTECEGFYIKSDYVDICGYFEDITKQNIYRQHKDGNSVTFNIPGDYYIQYFATPTATNNWCSDNNIEPPPPNTWQLLDSYENAYYAYCYAPSTATPAELANAEWILADWVVSMCNASYINVVPVECIADKITSFRIGSYDIDDLIDQVFTVANNNANGTARYWTMDNTNTQLVYVGGSNGWAFKDESGKYYCVKNDKIFTNNEWTFPQGGTAYLDMVDVILDV
jgi:hypothetical protein